MDFGTLAGLALAFGFILFGNHLEGGHIKSLIMPTAAMIVLGGTLGAVVVQFPIKRLMNAAKGTLTLFIRKKPNPTKAISQIVDFAKRARREGILALEKEIGKVDDPFFAKSLRMAVDGLEPKTLVETMEVEMETLETDADFNKKIWESAGGYCPTIGILGAVLGLIHVMSNLSDPSKLGGGIAIAFVATIYGVGAANLICLPFSNKIAFNFKEENTLREIELKGVLLIQEGINHSIIEEQLKSYLDAKDRKLYDAKYGGNK